MSTSMTRQHFRAIADAIARMSNLPPELKRQIAKEIGGSLRQFNSRFSVDTFTTAAVGEATYQAPPVSRETVKRRMVKRAAVAANACVQCGGAVIHTATDHYCAACGWPQPSS